MHRHLNSSQVREEYQRRHVGSALLAYDLGFGQQDAVRLATLYTYEGLRLIYSVAEETKKHFCTRCVLLLLAYSANQVVEMKASSAA